MYSLLGILAIVLLVVILFQLSKATELVGGMEGEEIANDRNNKLQAGLFLLTLVFGMIGIFWSSYYYSEFFLFLKEPAAEHSALIKGMYYQTLFAIVPIFVFTHILLFAFAYKYKQDRTRLAKFNPDNGKLEMFWILVPAVVMIFLVYQGIVNWYKITGPAPENALVIEATAQQFKWDIRYSGQDGKLGVKDISLMNPDPDLAKGEEMNPWGQNWDDKSNMDDFFAADSILLPVNRPIKVKINSLDVLHSFYLPEFNVKMDAVPGIPTQFVFTPTKTSAQRQEELNNPEFIYELACTELCGKAHFNMRREVYVVEPDVYEAWVKRQKPLYQTLKEATAGDTTEVKKGVAGI